MNGKVDKVAPDISVPMGSALVIDGTGKFITPGLIDCHSHSAASSINEGAQAVTAEVRIRDVLYADDVNIYRQLGGGLTTANILHGSANPIGMILSVGMMFKYSFGRADISNRIDKAVEKTVEDGCVTPDLGGTASTNEVTKQVIKVVEK